MSSAHRLLSVLCLVAGIAASAGAAAACDTQRLASLVRQTVPQFEVADVRVENGIVTLRLTRRGEAGTLAVSLLGAGSKLWTETMSAQLDEAERERASAAIESWYDNQELRQVLGQCNPGGTDIEVGASGVLRDAVKAALAVDDRVVGRDSLQPATLVESAVFVTALLFSLVLVLAPWPTTPADATRSRPMPLLDRGFVLAVALVGVAIATAIAWRLGPEDDEMATLGTRHGVLGYMLSWADGGEPFNPPGGPAIFAIWLRIANGFLWARALSIALIPITTWCAYRAGTAAVGRAVGLCFAALLALSPPYLRLAAIARGYSLYACALCWLLAAMAETKAGRSNGRSLGLASLASLSLSYLLWPLALAAPWITALDRRVRLRLSAALVLTAAALAPRVANGFASSQGKTDLTVFELKGPVDAIGSAFAFAGLCASGQDGGDPAWLLPTATLAALLAAYAVYRLLRTAPLTLGAALLALGLLLVPVLALLAGGHGIRQRHTLCLQLGLTWFVAAGLALLLSNRRALVRGCGWLLAGAVAVVGVIGNCAAIRASDGWIHDLAGMVARADLLVIAPRSAQFTVFAMLTGDAPEGSATVRWPPICPGGTESACRQLPQLRSVSVNGADDELVAAAATAQRSIWVFSLHDAAAARSVERLPRACRQLRHDRNWAIVECSSADLGAG